MGLDERVDNILLKMVTLLQSHPRVGPNVPMIIAVEAMGADAMYIAPKLQKIAIERRVNVCIMREMKESSAGSGWGVPKADTAALVASTREILSYNMLTIPDDCIAISSDHVFPKRTLEEYRRELYSQFMSFKKNDDGSINGKKGGKNDDLIITLMMCIFWSQVFCLSNRIEYGEFKYRYSNLWNTWQMNMPRGIASNIQTTKK